MKNKNPIIKIYVYCFKFLGFLFLSILCVKNNKLQLVIEILSVILYLMYHYMKVFLGSASIFSNLSSIVATPIDEEELSEFMPQYQKGKNTNSRNRTNISKEQADILQSVFEINPFPDVTMRRQLETVTELPVRVIQVWFQNRRREKKIKRKDFEDLPDDK